MALRNTSERYDYIYGNNVRKLEENTADSTRKSEVHRKQSAVKPKQKERSSAEKVARTSGSVKKNTAHFRDFDWKYTVVTIIAAIMCVSAGIFYVHGNTQLTVMENKISNLKTERTTLLSKQSALQAEIDKSINLDEIRAYAEKNLHMIVPKDSDILLYKGETYDYFRQYESVD